MKPSDPGTLDHTDRPDNKTIAVLVVDDEFSLRESCASLLRAEGYAVTLCGTG